MERNDIQGLQRAPQSIATYLLKRGGKNIFDEAHYRLVWAPTRMRTRGGKFQDWDHNLSAGHRGGMITLDSGLVIPSYFRPDRTVIGLRTRPMYPFKEGWILERWIPASYYGLPEDWYARVVPGTSIPFSGPYPHCGDFEMCHYSPSLELPSISELQTAMDRSERTKETHRSDVAQALLERANEDQAEYDAQQEKELAETQAFLRDLMTPIYATSLAAGRHRTKLAEKAGIYTHVGN